MKRHFGCYHDVFIEVADNLIDKIGMEINALRHGVLLPESKNNITRLVRDLMTNAAFVLFNDMADILFEMKKYMQDLEENKEINSPEIVAALDAYYASILDKYNNVERPEKNSVVLNNKTEEQSSLTEVEGVELFLMILDKHKVICSHNLGIEYNCDEEALFKYLTAIDREIRSIAGHRSGCDAKDRINRLLINEIRKTPIGNRGYIKWFVDDILLNKLNLSFDSPSAVRGEVRVFDEIKARRFGNSIISRDE